MSNQALEQAKTSTEVKEGALVVTDVVKYAKRVKITTEKGRAAATEKLSMVAGVRKAFEKKRKELVNPIKKAAKAVDDFFKEQGKPAAEAEEILRYKIGKFIDDAEAAAEKAQLAADKADHEATASAKDLGAAPPAPSQPVAVAPAKSVGGTSNRKVIDDIIVFDFKAVPDCYKMIDESKVKAAYKAGVTEIAGLNIKTKTALTVK